MIVALVVLAAILLLVGCSVRVITEYERGVVLRFGRVRPGIRGPGLALLAPVTDRLRKVNMQIVTLPVPPQIDITRDNVTVTVEAVIYFRVVDPVKVVVDVEDHSAAILQLAQSSLRSIIGTRDLDDLLAHRELLDQSLEQLIDDPAAEWGVHIDRVEIKDVTLPEPMRRSMSRQAESERERRSRVITAEGELQASQKMADAAEALAERPAALQLRLLQSVVAAAAENNSTLVLPFPVELLRFLEPATPPDERPFAAPTAATPARAARSGGPASDQPPDPTHARRPLAATDGAQADPQLDRPPPAGGPTGPSEVSATVSVAQGGNQT
ncbi:MAG: slipin family protein [Pseudonocardia sp.]|nr:slipin family protein [Pseudonocardia sp.]